MSDRPRRPARASRSLRPGLRNQLLFAVGILVLAAGAFYTAVVVASQIDHIFFPGNEIHLGGIAKKLPGVDSGDNADIGHGRINVLVVGVDRRYYEGDAPSRTDTMFVLTIDSSTHTARGLAMPRDLYVDIPTKSGNSTYKDRINTAYVQGETANYPNGGGVGLMKQVVANLLDIKINYYVMIDFEGFRKVIDLLGGIDVDVDEPGINDPYYSETEKLGDYYPCVFTPGLHHMNGSDALCYSRTRRNSDDLDRINRQQRVILAVMDKAASLNVLTNAGTLWKNYKDTIKTDINDFQIPGFARLAASIDPDQTAFMSIAAATTPYTTPEGAAVLLPSAEGIKQLRTAFLSDNRLLNEGATVEVQNGSGSEGQATKAIEYFASLGIPKTSLVAINAPADQGRTDIINYTGKSYTAERLADWLGVTHDRIRNATQADMALRNSQSDIVVILGSDAKLESAVAP